MRPSRQHVAIGGAANHHGRRLELDPHLVPDAGYAVEEDA